MTVARDDDWKQPQLQWANQFLADLAPTGLSQEAVAHAVGIDPKTLNNYIRVRTRVDARLLAPLAEAVGGDVIRWAELLGILPERLLIAGQALTAANRRIGDLEARLAEQQRSSGMTGRVAQAALVSGAFAVDVAPWIEGPPHCRMRVGDFVIIRRTDGGRCTADDIRQNEDLSQALNLANAVRVNNDVWDPDSKQGRPKPDDRAESWRWAIPHLNASRPSEALPKRCDLHTIAVVSTVLATWGSDVATLVGQALGYGSTNTGVLSRVQLGEELRDEIFFDPSARKGRMRAAIAADLLVNEDRTVWAHATVDGVDDFLDAVRRAPATTGFVVLQPTDRLLDWLTSQPKMIRPVEQRVEERERLREAIAELPNKQFHLDVGLPAGVEIGTRLSPAIRNAFLERSQWATFDVLRWLQQELDGPPLDGLHEACDPAFQSFASWAALRGAGSRPSFT